jgi:hypothetical protein
LNTKLQPEQQQTYKQTAHGVMAPTLMAMFKQPAHCVMALPFLAIMFNEAAHCVMAKFKHYVALSLSLSLSNGSALGGKVQTR